MTLPAHLQPGASRADVCPVCDDLAARGKSEGAVMKLWCGMGHAWERPITNEEVVAISATPKKPAPPPPRTDYPKHFWVTFMSNGAQLMSEESPAEILSPTMTARRYVLEAKHGNQCPLGICGHIHPTLDTCEESAAGEPWEAEVSKALFVAGATNDTFKQRIERRPAATPAYIPFGANAPHCGHCGDALTIPGTKPDHLGCLRCDWSAPVAPAPNTPTFARVVALLMREVLCEQVFRNKAAWNVEHPCRALELREITAEEIVSWAECLPMNGSTFLALDSKALKAMAARVLERIVAERQP